ncbi:hypothetical protein [Dokdonella koreensis]|uniref:Transmembrane protein n=1 Tax=Dokdonella koreensis DS-123 TaxID=1300342 RepID=A0A167HC10_9GAMM|nr:hypothetical protein [Dokdonella koreensis]ANB19793.1 Hypothetical protein I596_3810 [Dokdonella koreensis DS-123]
MSDLRFATDRLFPPVLDGLPEFTPDAALWSRIESARRQQLGRRRWTRAGGSLAAAAVFAAALVVLPRPTPAPVASDALAGRLQQSQALEQEWSRLDPQPALAAGMPPGSVSLRRIDAALQAAYDRGAGDEELAPLWEARNQALRVLIENRRDAVVTVRI